MSDNKPNFWRQSAEPYATKEDLQSWFECAATEMRAQGAAFFQFSVHDTIPHLRLIEGWKDRPDDYGEPRWALMRGLFCEEVRHD